MLPVSISEVMSENLVSVREHDLAFDALRLMRSRGVLRVPLTDGGTGLSIGNVTADDVMEIVRAVAACAYDISSV